MKKGTEGGKACDSSWTVILTGNITADDGEYPGKLILELNVF